MMYDEHLTEYTARASEALRAANHVSIDPRHIRNHDEFNDALADLSDLQSRITPLVTRLIAWVNRHSDQDTIESPIEVTEDLVGYLMEYRDASTEAWPILNDARQRAARLIVKGEVR